MSFTVYSQVPYFIDKDMLISLIKNKIIKMGIEQIPLIIAKK